MSIFSRISRSRQQAKDYNAKVNEQKMKEDSKPAYKHIPTHAASDAIASAPPGWRDCDRIRIREEHLKRMNMLANQRMGIPGMPRVGSSLSHVSYPTYAHAHAMVHTPRAHSYSGVNYSQPRTRPGAGSPPPQSTSSSPKGKEVYGRGAAEVHLGTSYSKTAVGGSGSSDNSSSSQDDLEIGGRRRGSASHARQPGRSVYAPGDVVFKPRSSRRISDSSIDRIAMANTGRASDSRPPSAMKASVPSSSRTQSPEHCDAPRAAVGGSRRDAGSQKVSWASPSAPTQISSSASYPYKEGRGADAEPESHRGSPSPEASQSDLYYGRASPADLPPHASALRKCDIPDRRSWNRSSDTGTASQESVPQSQHAGTEDPLARSPTEHAAYDSDSDSDVSFKSAQLLPSAERASSPPIASKTAPTITAPLAPQAAPTPPPPSPPPAAPAKAQASTTSPAGTTTTLSSTATTSTGTTAAAAAAKKQHYVVNYLPEAETAPQSMTKSRRLSKSGKSGNRGRWPFHKHSAVAVV